MYCAHLADDVVALLVSETSPDLLESELDTRVGGLSERATIHPCELVFSYVLAHTCSQVAVDYREHTAQAISIRTHDSRTEILLLKVISTLTFY